MAQTIFDNRFRDHPSFIASKKKEPRPNFIWAFLGASGYGKTITSIEVAKKWRANNPGKKIYVFDPKGDIQASGILRKSDLSIPRGMKHFGHILTKQTPDKKFIHRDFLLILDDYKAILTDDRTPDSFLDFLYFAREMNVDVILSTHSPALIIPRLAYYVTHYSIFYTLGSAGGFSEKSANFVTCEQARIWINKYVMEYGKCMHQFPNFPHIEVDSMNDRSVTLKNMDKEKMMALVA